MDDSVLLATEGRCRVVVENVQPVVDCGRFPIKRTPGEHVEVTADVFADGHDTVRTVLLSRKVGDAAWHVTPMQALGNDRWRASFDIAEMVPYEYAVRGWVDAFETWHHDLKKRIAAEQNITIDLQIGAKLLGQAAARAEGEDAERLRHWQNMLTTGEGASAYQAAAAELEELSARYPDLRYAAESKPLRVEVERERARFSTWYELFPRSTTGDPNRHGTFRDCVNWLPRIAAMGFDVVYLPPIHPVGIQFRKGKNNSTQAQPDDVGSPWAIGGPEGGHKAIHPELGTLADFHALVAAAHDLGIDIALDIAFQCSPDHPYVQEHPEWFRSRPDGTIQYAENPPKKYQDIYPFDFESTDWQGLWRELTSVFLYWCEQGVRIFRVDNPHTKSLAFWEYCLAQVKAKYPETIFLSEAFTRPRVMYRLAKAGFTQSYTYFTWRNTREEFVEYLTELTESPVKDFFRPNFWPNTPDILPEHLQVGGRAAFVARLVLAGTLSSNYGIYGPAFETMEHLPRESGSEEYLNSEKYQIRAWDFNRPDNLGGLIGKLNHIRRENPALQSNERLVFHPTDNPNILCYSKRSEDGCNLLLMVVNLNFHETHHGVVQLRMDELGLSYDRPYQLHEMFTDQMYTWQGDHNFVKLDPNDLPVHVFRVAQA